MDQGLAARRTRAILRVVALTDQVAAARERLADELDLLVINTAILAYRRERLVAERVAFGRLCRYQRSNGRSREPTSTAP